MSKIASSAGPAELIAQAIIERLECGVRPWVKPWSGSAPAKPLRACGQAYTGINLFWLWLVAEARGFVSPFWMTYRQATDLGGQVRRGERSTIAVFYKALASVIPAEPEEADRTREAKPRRVARSYAVFNADQVDGLPASFAGLPTPAELAADGVLGPVEPFFAALPAKVVTGGSIAAYDRIDDLILMPAPSRFISRDHYHACLAHEHAHWTGHPDRLARTFGRRFGDEAYAVEELCAELTSAILGAELNLPVAHLDDHAAYIGSWINALTRVPRLLLTVASKAQAAADFLLTAAGRVPGAARRHGGTAS